MSQEKLKITLDENNASFQCFSDDSILRGALRNGVPMSYECNSGGCGSCKFELIEGEVEELWSDAPGLSRRDLRKGKKLACQCVPKTDCTIKAQTNSEIIPNTPKRFNVTYKGKTQLTDDMAEFRFQAEEPAKFLAGQFAMFTLPNITGDRAYSMSNIVNEAGYWQFIIKNMPEGEATHYLFNELKEGDKLSIDGPYGNAYLREDNDRDIVLIAGGSGLSPVVSIARSLTMNDAFAGRKVYLFYGGRGPQDICTPQLTEELNPLSIELVCHNAVSDEALAKADNWDGPCCFIHELVEQKLGKTMPDYEYYFCGPPPMTEAVQRLVMIDYQVPFEQVHFDRFF